jgi:hypothetical protein
VVVLLGGRRAGGNDGQLRDGAWAVQVPSGSIRARRRPGEATFDFAANEPVAGFECFLDGVTEPCSSPVTYTDLATGKHVFAVLAVDDTPSNPSAFEDHEWEIVAPAPPNTSFASGPPVLTTDTTATFTFTGTDNITPEADLTFECSLDGAPFTVCTSPHEITDLSSDVHTLEVRAIDESGAPDPTPAVYTWTVQGSDTTPPETTITAGPVAIGLTPGQHTYAVRAIDDALNVDPTPAERAWTTVDATAPETSIDSGPASLTEATTASFTFSSDEAGVTFECLLDGASFTACASPAEVTGLAPGDHTFRVRSRDQLRARKRIDAKRAGKRVTTEPGEETEPKVIATGSGTVVVS